MGWCDACGGDVGGELGEGGEWFGGVDGVVELVQELAGGADDLVGGGLADVEEFRDVLDRQAESVVDEGEHDAVGEGEGGAAAGSFRDPLVGIASVTAWVDADGDCLSGRRGRGGGHGGRRCAPHAASTSGPGGVLGAGWAEGGFQGSGAGGCACRRHVEVSTRQALADWGHRYLHLSIS